MAGSPTLMPKSRLGSTLRRDPWWIEILPMVLVLGGFGVYATLRAFEGKYYEWGPYLSPFYSPLLDPPACAVGESPRRTYRGETAFPFILQNVHRYFFYLAVLFIIFLWYDAIRSFFFDGHFGVGVGTLVLTLNVILLSLYTFSCHSLRHLAGGKLDCFSCATFGRSRFEAWRLST